MPCEDGILFVNSSQVVDIDRKHTRGKIIAIPATDLAKEMGNEKVTNMIMLGAAIEKTGIVKIASAIKVLGKIFKGLRKDLIYVNEKALLAGAEIMRQKVLEEGMSASPLDACISLFRKIISHKK
jgi:2-oxoglutarate ferredoxin oxidoreductase subunit gamma